MSYKNKLLLTDGAYRPIPQWYDPTLIHLNH